MPLAVLKTVSCLWLCRLVFLLDVYVVRSNVYIRPQHVQVVHSLLSNIFNVNVWNRTYEVNVRCCEVDVSGGTHRQWRRCCSWARRSPAAAWARCDRTCCCCCWRGCCHRGVPCLADSTRLRRSARSAAATNSRWQPSHSALWSTRRTRPPEQHNLKIKHLIFTYLHKRAL